MQEDKEVVFNRTDLASRGLAAIEREYISNTIKANERIIVNMEKVLCITCGYADELFGILVKEHGIEKVADKIQLIGSDAVLEQIAKAMIWRKDEIQNKERHNEVPKSGRTDGGKQIPFSGL